MTYLYNLRLLEYHGSTNWRGMLRFFFLHLLCMHARTLDFLVLRILLLLIVCQSVVYQIRRETSTPDSGPQNSENKHFGTHRLCLFVYLL